jgi:dUTPase
MFGKKASDVGLPATLPTSQEFTYLPPVILKSKKWVTHENSKRTGIIYDMSKYGFVTIAFTNDKGETVTMEEVRVGELRVAKYEEIPAPRRPDKATAFTLGYY